MKFENAPSAKDSTEDTDTEHMRYLGVQPDITLYIFMRSHCKVLLSYNI